MSDATTSGGPAFPHVTHSPDPESPVLGLKVKRTYHGLTVRDYFAAHLPAPTRAELCAAADVELDVTDHVLHTSDALDIRRPDFASWWHAMTNEDRANITARARWMAADAMLAERGR